MKMKTVFVGLGSLFLSCFTFYPLLATNTIPIMTTIIGDDDGGTGAKFIADENCEIHIIEAINAINLHNYPINSGTPLIEGEAFFLPSYYPPMALQYSIGNTSGTIRVDTFTYGGVKNTPNGPVQLFYFPVNITVDVTDGCYDAREEGGFEIAYEYTIVDLSNVAPDDSPAIYPICRFRASTEAFACDFFDYCSIQEGRGTPTCYDSDWTTKNGGYVVQCHEFCLPEGGTQTFRKTAPVNAISTTEVQLSPNPFSDRVEVTISDASSFPPQSLEIYSIHGELLDRIPVALEKAFPSNIVLELGHLPPGIYLLQINQAQKNQTHKLIKK